MLGNTYGFCPVKKSSMVVTFLSERPLRAHGKKEKRLMAECMDITNKQPHIFIKAI